jgi:hypothetical protein
MSEQEDVFDEVEEITYAQPRGREAEGLEAAARELPAGARLRAELLVSASEWWLSREEYAAARRCAEDAVADGGTTWVDARAMLLAALLPADPDGARELEAALRQEVLDRPDAADVIDLVGESLQQAAWHREAARWFTLGLGDVDPDAIEPEDDRAAYLLTRRTESRRALGLRPDRYDLAEVRVRRDQEEQRRVEEGDWGWAVDVDPDASLDDIGLLYWPSEEYAAVVARWPHLAEGYGGSADGHRLLTEAHLRARAETLPRVLLVPGSLAGLLEVADEEDLAPEGGAARTRLASRRIVEGQAVRWPPGRNEPCWCGSGRKYKQCCGKPQ